jgi:hypothetical protein
MGAEVKKGKRASKSNYGRNKPEDRNYDKLDPVIE